MDKRMRVVMAFIISPLIVPIIMYCLFSVFSVSVPLPGFLVATLLVTLVVTLILGLPAFLMFKAWNLDSLKSFTLGGFVLGFAPGGVLALTSGAIEFWLVPIASGAQGALFWLIAMKEPNKALNTDTGSAGAG